MEKFFIREPARDVPVAEECDICVVGGSCTGVFAAVAAARLGAKTVIIEKNGFFGGTATAGLVNVWHSLHDTSGENQIIAGLTSETIERLERADAVRKHGDEKKKPSFYTLNTAELAFELDSLVTGAGVRPFLHARFSAASMEGPEIKGVVIEDKTGRRAVLAKYFVDATGDADLCARAGLEMRTGDDLQPPTCCAYFRGLEAVREKNKNFSLAEAVFNRNYRESLNEGTLWGQDVVGAPELMMIAGTRVHGADCSDADELTSAEIQGRRQVRRIRSLLRNNFQGGKEVSVAAFSSCIGVRETVKVKSLHHLTETEILEGKRFEDAVANGTYRVDIHHSSRGGLTFRYLDGREEYCFPDGRTESGRWRPSRDEDPAFYQVPYGTLVPEGAVNVISAGRMADTDRGAHGAVRVMVNTNQMGEAAGTAAYLALESGLQVSRVDGVRLRKLLSANGAAVV